MAKKSTKKTKPAKTTSKKSKPEAAPTASGQMTLGYQGLVSVTYQTKAGKTIHFKGHNEGMNAMFKYLCRALSGDFKNISSEKPTYLDLKCIYFDESDDGGKTKTISCLYSPISISAPEYYYDTTNLQWATRFNLTLSYNMINYDLIDAHPDGAYYLYLISASNNDFARITIDEAGLRLKQLMPGTQALIEWLMIIQNVHSSSL